MEYRLDQAKEILRRTPATLNALLSDLPNDWVLANEGPETFSPYDVIGHLIEGEENDWIPRARIILEHGEARPFEKFDRFAMYEKSKGKSPAELLARFEEVRGESLRQFDELNLTPELLQKRGSHPALGVVTLSQLLSAWVVHDLGHIRQIVRVMAKQYREEIGPWTAYLSIVN
ncbi:MAG TPA: DinB family protein [Pyrinomonadaceae bacterium]|jgi:hypothetical protein|nr:DinB family protein [Pyrinomonadaceae bacterium]